MSCLLVSTSPYHTRSPQFQGEKKSKLTLEQENLRNAKFRCYEICILDNTLKVIMYIEWYVESFVRRFYL